MNARVRIIAGAALAVVVVGATAGITYASHNDRTVYRADVMAPVSGVYTGATKVENAIRGVVGGGAPWVISHADIRLRESGRVDVEIEGLIVDPAAPVPPAGTNPATMWKVTVSCLSTAGANAPVNVSSEPFPADITGNAEARVHVDLPSPCFAPIVFITAGVDGGPWFAVSGA